MFVIGVTGHRDLSPVCIDDVNAAIKALLDDLKSRLPGADIALMSGLADGADRLAAQCAIDLGIRVLAVLPMEKRLYEEDFSTASREEFERLLYNSLVDTVELPTIMVDATPDRDACYKNLTDSLIRKSNLLVAVWDGVDTGLIGGTSDTLLSYLGEIDGRVSENDAMEFLSTAPISPESLNHGFWIPTQRTSGSNNAELPNDAVFVSGIAATKTVVLDENMPDVLSDQISQLQEYCADAHQLAAAGKSDLSWGLPDTSSEQLASDRENLIDRIKAEFIRADGLAIFYQKKSDTLFKAFSVVAALLGLLFLVYAKLVANNIFLYGYVFFFVVSFGIYKLAASQHWLSKHIMYRLIAETLRVRFFLRRAGADELVDLTGIARLSGIDRLERFGWILQLFKDSEPVSRASAEDADSTGALLSTAKEQWVDDQSQYFHNKIHSMHKEHHRVERIKSTLIMIVLAAVVVLIFFKYQLLTNMPGVAITYKSFLVFLMGLFPFWLAVWELYHNKMATKELLWQYRNQADTFALAEYQLDQSSSIDERRRVIADLATKALLENYQWTIQRIQREHEPPAAG